MTHPPLSHWSQTSGLIAFWVIIVHKLHVYTARIPPHLKEFCYCFCMQQWLDLCYNAGCLPHSPWGQGLKKSVTYHYCSALGLLFAVYFHLLPGFNLLRLTSIDKASVSRTLSEYSMSAFELKYENPLGLSFILSKLQAFFFLKSLFLM